MNNKRMDLEILGVVAGGLCKGEEMELNRVAFAAQKSKKGGRIPEQNSHKLINQLHVYFENRII